jgi:uncharacterized protein (DUF2164 family)
MEYEILDYIYNLDPENIKQDKAYEKLLKSGFVTRSRAQQFYNTGLRDQYNIIKTNAKSAAQKAKTWKKDMFISPRTRKKMEEINLKNPFRRVKTATRARRSRTATGMRRSRTATGMRRSRTATGTRQRPTSMPSETISIQKTPTYQPKEEVKRLLTSYKRRGMKNLAERPSPSTTLKSPTISTTPEGWRKAWTGGIKLKKKSRKKMGGVKKSPSPKISPNYIPQTFYRGPGRDKHLQDKLQSLWTKRQSEIGKAQGTRKKRKNKSNKKSN